MFFIKKYQVYCIGSSGRIEKNIEEGSELDIKISNCIGKIKSLTLSNDETMATCVEIISLVSKRDSENK